MRIALVMTTEFEKRLLKTGVQILFSVMSSAILNCSADYCCISSLRLAALDNAH